MQVCFSLPVDLWKCVVDFWMQFYDLDQNKQLETLISQAVTSGDAPRFNPLIAGIISSQHCPRSIKLALYQTLCREGERGNVQAIQMYCRYNLLQGLAPPSKDHSLFNVPWPCTFRQFANFISQDLFLPPSLAMSKSQVLHFYQLYCHGKWDLVQQVAQLVLLESKASQDSQDILRCILANGHLKQAMALENATFALTIAAKYGCIDVVKWLVHHFEINKMQHEQDYNDSNGRSILASFVVRAFYNAYRGGCVELVEWLATQFDLQLQHLVNFCHSEQLDGENGSPNCILWVSSQLARPPREMGQVQDMLQMAKRNDHFEIVLCGLRQFGPRLGFTVADFGFLFHRACVLQHFATIQYLTKLVLSSPYSSSRSCYSYFSDASVLLSIEQVIQQGNLKLLRYLLKHWQSTSSSSTRISKISTNNSTRISNSINSSKIKPTLAHRLCHRAIKAGQLPILQWLLVHSEIRDMSLVTTACKYESVDIFQFLFRYLRVDPTDSCQGASLLSLAGPSNGKWNIFVYLLRLYKGTDAVRKISKVVPFCIEILCSKGYVKDAQYLLQHMQITKQKGSFKLLSDVCERGDLQTAQWLTSVYSYEPVKTYALYTFVQICHRGHLQVAQWFADFFKVASDSVREYGGSFWHLCNGNTEMAKWLLAESRVDQDSIFLGLISHNVQTCNFAVIRWLYETGVLSIFPEWFITHTHDFLMSNWIAEWFHHEMEST